MTLPQYYRTPKGNQALEDRSVKLSSRQRALLLMIETGHATQLSQQQLRQLATPDNLDVLLSHQLISTAEPATQTAPDLQHGQSSDNGQPTPVFNRQSESENKPAFLSGLIPDLTGQDVPIARDLHSAAMVQAKPDLLSFDEVKQLMMSSLREYCGLLASALIKDIQHASSVAKLRMCQMRWVTTLTETRASSAQIAVWVEQINYSLSCPSDSSTTWPEALTL